MHITVRKALKKLLILFFVVIVGVGFYIAWFLLFHNDIPLTKANSNELKLAESMIHDGTIQNRWGESMSVKKGFVTVLENRNKPEGNKISIGFMKIPTANEKPASPIFFLSGGPGTPVSSLAKRDYFYVFEKLSEYADVVLIDQRGTGDSIPNLRCRNNMEIPNSGIQDSQQEILSEISNKVLECAEEFRDLGIDLSGYNSKESAHDIETIRKLLEMDKISLFGYSYGSSLAQTYLKYFESYIDKLIFAGPIAPDMELKLSTQMIGQYKVMDSLIQQDKKMRKYIPSFTELMRQENIKLSTTPLEIELPLMNAVNEDDGFLPVTLFKIISWFKPYWEFVIDNNHMQIMMAQNIGRDAWTRIAPRYYYLLSQEKYNRLGNYYRNFRRQNMPNALFFTVAATTSATDKRLKDALSVSDENLLSHFSISFGRDASVLSGLGLKKIEGLSEPVFSNKPLLMIAGTLDGRTPLENSETIGERFKNSTKLTVENGSHNDLIEVDVLEQLIQFIQYGSIEKDTIERSFDFLPPVDYQYNLIDTLEAIRINEGILSAMEKYKDLRAKHKYQEDYYYDISERNLNKYGFQLLNQDQHDDAMVVFKLSNKLHPDSQYSYSSLASGFVAQGEFESALIHFRKAVEIDYLNGYTRSQLSELEQKLR